MSVFKKMGFFVIPICMWGTGYAAIINYQGGAGSMGTITISATVADACDVSVPDLFFGAYDPNNGTATTQDATISYTCTTGTTPSLGIAETTLAMSGPGAGVINYTLYQGAGGTGTGWSNGANYSLPTATGSAQTATYSGSIAPGQFVQAGSYSQDLTISLSF